MSTYLESLIPREFINPSPEFRAAMESMAIHWWYWDNVNKNLIISPQLMELLGYTGDEFDASVPTLDKNIHPADSEENRKVFKAFLSGESEVYEMEYRLKVGDKWCWYYNRGSVITRNEEGFPELIGGITLDISDRYTRLLSQVEQGSKFEFIFRNTSEAVLIVKMGMGDIRGRILEVNAAAAHLFACDADDLIGLDPIKLFDPALVEKREEYGKELQSTGSLRLEFRTQNFQGKNIFLEVNTHAFTETGENLYIALVKDKTETIAFREELKASESALRQSERIYRLLIQAAEDRIGLFDIQGNPVILNNAFYESLGFTHEEFIALKNRERVHPDDVEIIEKARPQLLEKGFHETEYRAQHRNGHYLYMSSKSVILKDEDLDKDYILFIIRDVTEKFKFQEELKKAKERAVESDKLKSAFLANMSHEIRTPMNSIVGFANLLSEEDIDDATKDEYVRRINRNSQHLLALISDIIDLAKIESNQLSVIYTNVILDNLFCDLINYGRLQLDQREKKEVSINYLPDEAHQNLIIESDLVRLTQIMQNLVNNAVKFTASGEINIGYKLIDEAKVSLFVSDTGTGIERKNFEIIFDQFRQVDGSNVRKYGGTGLGLAICKNLTELLKGRIWVESVLDEGSVFYVELPLRSGYNVEKKPSSKNTNTAVSDKITVLLVDDDQDSLMLMTTLLRNEGVQTITADSGYKALEILEREALPDVVLMDLQMPVISGAQTLKIIREIHPDIKVIAQSAHALEGEKDRSLLAGFDDYISKPFSRQGLFDVIKRVVGS